jgi:hypothetical protein
MLGAATVVGGVLGVVLAPIMVAIKYLTGWAVIPEPFWIAPAAPMLSRMLAFGSPAQLWVLYGSFYTVALLLMLAGLLSLITQLRHHWPGQKPWGLWLLVGGLTVVIGGDAVHTLTWHQHGLTVPTPGTNPIANTGYAVHMMGMNVMLAGSLITGLAALRKHFLPRSLAWLFVSVAPSAVVISLTLLPTSPSGGLWMFSATMIVFGARLSRDAERSLCKRRHIGRR